MLHNFQQLFIHGADRLRKLRNNGRALPAGSEDVRQNTSSSSSLLSSAADEREILIPLSNSSASSICDPHDLSLLAASATAGPEPRGGQMIAPILSRKGTNESGAFPQKSSQWAIPSRTECACSSLKHITHKSCVSSGVRKRWHESAHLLKRFTTDIVLTLQKQMSPEDKKEDDVFHRCPFIPADTHLLTS